MQIVITTCNIFRLTQCASASASTHNKNYQKNWRISIEAYASRLNWISLYDFVKCFNQTSNYAKGNGDTFWACMEEHHTETILCYVKSTMGNRQDIVCSNAVLIHTNLPFYVNLLDERLRKHKHSNILEENLHAF